MQRARELIDDYMSGGDSGDGAKNEVFYTEGPVDLKNCRLMIAKYSLPRAQERLRKAKEKRANIENCDVEDNNL